MFVSRDDRQKAMKVGLLCCSLLHKFIAHFTVSTEQLGIVKQMCTAHVMDEGLEIIFAS